MLALGLAVPCTAPPRPRAATISGLNLIGGSSHSALGVQPLPKSTMEPLMVWGAGHKAQAGRPPALTGTLQLERRGAGMWLPDTHAHPLVLLGTKPQGAPRATAHSHCARWWLLILVPDPFAGGHSSSPPRLPHLLARVHVPQAANAPTFTMCLLVSPATQPPRRTPAPFTLRNRYEPPQSLRPPRAPSWGGFVPHALALLPIPYLS